MTPLPRGPLLSVLGPSGKLRLRDLFGLMTRLALYRLSRFVVVAGRRAGGHGLLVVSFTEQTDMLDGEGPGIKKLSEDADMHGMVTWRSWMSRIRAHQLNQDL